MIGETRYLSNTQKIVVAKIYIYDVTDEWIYIKTYITDDVLNPSILKIPTIELDNIIFDNIEDAMVHMGIHFYKEYGLDGFDKKMVDKIIDNIRIHIDTDTIMSWIQLAKEKNPEKFI